MLKKGCLSEKDASSFFEIWQRILKERCECVIAWPLTESSRRGEHGLDCHSLRHKWQWLKLVLAARSIFEDAICPYEDLLNTLHALKVRFDSVIFWVRHCQIFPCADEEHVRRYLLEFSQHRIIVLQTTIMSRDTEKNTLALMSVRLSRGEWYRLCSVRQCRALLLPMTATGCRCVRSNVRRDIDYLRPMSYYLFDCIRNRLWMCCSNSKFDQKSLARCSNSLESV